jgi:hypothetical protein
MVMEHRLKNILNILYKEGIQVVPLKGAFLQGLIYQDDGIRAMNDIDILVHPKDYRRSAELLTQAGCVFVSKGRYTNFPQLQKTSQEDWPGELGFVDGQGLVIDLHQQLIPSHWFTIIYDLNMDDIWQRSVQLMNHDSGDEAGRNFLWSQALSPYDMLAYLCLHVALHGLQVSKNFLDIDLWIRKLPNTWNWNQFTAVVNQWQIRSVVYHALLICKVSMDTPVPDLVLGQMNPGRHAQWRMQRFMSPRILIGNQLVLGRRYPTLVKLALADHSSKILLAVLKLLFPRKTSYSRHYSAKGILGHWLHVLEVIRRGD